MCKNNAGFTLVEFLVAITILMVGMLGLLQGVNVSLTSNMQNQLRNEALAVADSALSQELSKPFDIVSTSRKGENVSRQVLNSFKNFSVVRNGDTAVDYEFSSSKEVRLEVSWRHRGVRYTHLAGGVVSKVQQ